MPSNPNCELCILHQSSKNVCIWGHGGGGGFVVGEAPGREEAKTGKPFMGKAGQFGRPILAEFGLEDPYITNAAKCRPPNNRKPEPNELKACKPYLLEEIEARKPKAILLWGATAMKACIGKTGITEMNGQVVEKDGQTYVCCFHPAFILRDPSKEAAFRMAVGRYAAVLKGTHNAKMPDWRVIDKSSIEDFLRSWTDAGKISFDVETTGLDWWNEGFEINCISFSCITPYDEENWVLPLAIVPVLTYELRKEFLLQLAHSTRGKRMIAQNGKFDNLCLMKCFGVQFHLEADTMLASHLTDENSSHALKNLARQWCGAPDYDIPLKEKKGGTLPTKLFAYNAADAAYTGRLDSILCEKMDQDEKWLYNKVIMPAARAFESIESNGLYVDLERMAVVEAEERRELNSLRLKLNHIAKRKVNWNSPAQVAEVLYRDLGLTPTVLTEKKKPSTGELALVDIDHPIAKFLTKYREHEKFLSTYIGELQENGTYTGGWRDFMVGPHLYLSTKLHGTVTGRYSSRLHQVPRDGTVRNVVIAPPGWDFVQLDLAQAELKVIAILSRDPEMLACFKSGRDIHWRTLMGVIHSGGGEYVDTVYQTVRKLTKRRLGFDDAIQIVSDLGPDRSIELISDWKEGRKKAKGINFGFCFDQSPPGFVNYVKTKYGFEPTLAEATQFHATYFDLYRALSAWHERQRKLAHQDGFVRSMSGRKRRLPGIHSSDRQIVSECERQAINSPVQGYIGDHKAMILVELDETFPKDQLRIVGEVHDSILMWIKHECLEILSEVKERAENPRLVKECGLKFPIPLTVDIEVGPWGAGKRYKP